MKVFITGGTGFIGSHIVVELLAQGNEVRLLARNPHKIPAFLEHPCVSILEGGLDDEPVIRRGLDGCDACIHNAIYWEDEPTELQMKDTRASNRLFESAAEAGISHMVYTSSTAVHRPFQPRMDETQRISPTDFYGATKAANEAFLSAFSHQTSMRCTIVRPGPTVGGPATPGGPVKYDGRFHSIAEAAIRGDDIHVLKNDGRQFIAASDLAKIYSAVINGGGSSAMETYLAVARDFITWEQIAKEAISLAGPSSNIVLDDKGLSNRPFFFDTTKLKDTFELSFECAPTITSLIHRLVGTESIGRSTN